MNIKQLMVTFFIALLVGGEIGARVLTDKFVYSQGEKVVFTFDGKSEGKTIILKYLSKKGEPVLAELVENHLFGKFLQNLRLQP